MANRCSTSYDQAWEWARDAVRDVALFSAGPGVKVVIEPTPEDSNIVNTYDDTIAFTRDAGEPNMKLVFDSHRVA